MGKNQIPVEEWVVDIPIDTADLPDEPPLIEDRDGNIRTVGGELVLAAEQRSKRAEPTSE